MTFRKILAVLLCAAAVVSVMAVMAIATQAQRAPAAEIPVAAGDPVAAQNAPPPPSNEPTTRPTNTGTTGTTRNIIEWFRNSWSRARGGYNTWMYTWQKILLFGLRVIVLLTNNFAFMRPSA